MLTYQYTIYNLHAYIHTQYTQTHRCGGRRPRGHSGSAVHSQSPGLAEVSVSSPLSISLTTHLDRVRGRPASAWSADSRARRSRRRTRTGRYSGSLAAGTRHSDTTAQTRCTPAAESRTAPSAWLPGQTAGTCVCGCRCVRADSTGVIGGRTAAAPQNPRQTGDESYRPLQKAIGKLNFETVAYTERR